MRRRWLLEAAVVLVCSAAFGATAWSQETTQFDHARHQRMFPSCDGCHDVTGDAATFPQPGLCSACHDGGVAPRLDWPGRSPRASNLRFNHTEVVAAKKAALGMDFQCSNCHVSGTGENMVVERAKLDACMGCHAPGQEHRVGAPCQTCHVALAQATTMSPEQIQAFPRPSDHAEGFLARHGPLASENTARCGVCHARDFCSACHVNAASVPAIQALEPDARVAQLTEQAEFTPPESHTGTWPMTHGQSALESVSSCAVCHAREYCSSCHVNAGSVPAIQQLSPHPRGPAAGAKRTVTYPTPASHTEGGWLEKHGRAAGDDGSTCATCHAQPSCESCHVPPLPPAVEKLPRPTPPSDGDRATAPPQQAQGVMLARNAPATHTPGFAESHQALAATATTQCAVCHTPDQCTSCHTGSAAMTAPGQQVARYHPANFQQQHSASAFGRSVECATCHNPEAFCRDCHSTRGLASAGRTVTGFHASKPTFSLGHGQAARQGLESCASCHAQSDCLQCHSSRSGRGVNPHGPGFNAEKLSSRNPRLCDVCHR